MSTTVLPTLPAADTPEPLLEIAHVESPAPRDAWLRAYLADPLAVASQAPAYLDAIVACGARDASRLLVTTSGREIVLPMVRARALPRRLGRYRTFDLHWDIGGPIAAGGVTAAEIALVARELGRDGGLSTRVVANPLHAGAWHAAMPPAAVRIPRCAHVVDLEGGYEEVERRYAARAHRHLKTARNRALSVRSGNGADLVEEFFELYRLSIRRWAEQSGEPFWLARLRYRAAEPISRLHALREHLGDALRVFLCYVDDTPAAGIVVFFGTNATYFRGAMNKELAAPARANYVLQATAIEEACERGCRWYHMGESGTSEALSSFKEGFGAVPHPYDEYRLERVPFTRADRALRAGVKRAIGFREASGRPASGATGSK